MNYFDKVKLIILDLQKRKFWGMLRIEINFKEGGITKVHSEIKEEIK